MKKLFIYSIIFSIFSIQLLMGQENNFLAEIPQMTKTQYRAAMIQYELFLANADVEKLQKEIEKLQVLDAASTEEEIKEIAKWLYIVLDATILSRDSNAINCNYDDIYTRLLGLYEQTNNEFVRLKTMQSIALICWANTNNYELSFEYSLQLCKLIETMPDSCFPCKTGCYVELGERFYYFQEYDEAIVRFNKVHDYQEKTIYIQAQKLSALNGLGLSYRNKGDMELSNNYFNKILTVKPDLDKWVLDLWSGIAKGNLGYNLYLEKKYDEAIPLFEYSLQKMTEYNDFAYASGTAINLANIYLEKRMLKKSLDCGNLAYAYEKRMPRTGRLENIFFFFHKYYVVTNNSSKALLYLDSALAEQKQNDVRFKANQLLRVEQRMHAAEQKAKENEIMMAKNERDAYQKTPILLFVGGILVLILLFFIYNLYRKKQKAYQLLVRKSQQWANKLSVLDTKDDDDQDEEQEDEIEYFYDDIASKEEAKALIKEVFRLLEENDMYKDKDLTLQKLADTLQTNRSYLSKAINSILGTNFISLVNDYRIKEAVKILSDPASDHLSIDALAEKVGFTNRFTFSTVFKKNVGITPSEFRKNREE